jgi:hypothetical protein
MTIPERAQAFYPTYRLLLLSFVLLSCVGMVNAQTIIINQTNTTNIAITMPASTDGVSFGMTAYLLVGFVALLFGPVLAGNITLKEAMTTEKLLNDTIRRSFYIMALLAYLATGAWLYQDTAALGIDVGWIVTTLIVMLGAVLFLISVYLVFRIMFDSIRLAISYTKSRKYGQESKNSGGFFG